MSGDALRIALNATSLLSPLTGVGQYTRSLAESLAARPDVELHLFYGAKWSRTIRTQPVQQITRAKQLFKFIAPRPYRLSRWLSQPHFSRGTAKYRIQLSHEPAVLPYVFEGPTVVSVHDLSWIRYPETHPRQRVDALNRMFPHALAGCDHVITDAKFVREEIIRDFGMPPERITAIPLAARSVFVPRDAVRCEFALSPLSLSYRSFILCVGTLEPRKNLEFVVSTYAKMPPAFRERWPLVIVGMKGWLHSSLEEVMQPLVSTGHIRVLGFASDETLAALYASARVLVYPSLYEGFGLPPLEAMASATPVIASNQSTLPEVVDAAGVLIDPHDESALKEALQRVTDDQAIWTRLSASSLQQASKFSWQKCAAQTVAVYCGVLAKH